MSLGTLIDSEQRIILSNIEQAHFNSQLIDRNSQFLQNKFAKLRMKINIFQMFHVLVIITKNDCGLTFLIF